MFTGIIEATGKIESLTPDRGSIRIGISVNTEEFPVSPGNSVSVDGSCLTMTNKNDKIMFFEAVAETLSKTTLAKKRKGGLVNLERALRVSSRIDGHYVTGHVDCTGKIIRDTRAGSSILRTISIPEHYNNFTAVKGSVTVDGISLTITESHSDRFTVSIIPYTFSHTTMELKKTGDLVNIEFDILARYIFQILCNGNKDIVNNYESQSYDLLNKMEESGF